MNFTHDIKELGTYVDSLLKDIAKETKTPLTPLMVEYIQLSSDLMMYTEANKGFQPLTNQQEIIVYEAAAEAIFEKYIK